MVWIAGIVSGVGHFFAGLAFILSAIFPRPGDMDSAAKSMTADMPAFEHVRAVLASDPALRWIGPQPGMPELGEPPNQYPVTDATRARYRELAAFLTAKGFRDVAQNRQNSGALGSFRLVMVDEGYFGLQKTVEGVWLADGEPISTYEANAHCRAVRAPHWHVCQLN
jgi:hypothetical protein